jgi:hypothetical protein
MNRKHLARLGNRWPADERREQLKSYGALAGTFAA